MKSFVYLFLLISFGAKGQAINDEPCNALALTVVEGYGFCQQLNFSMANATYNPAFNNVSCPVSAGNSTPADVWFKFAAPAGGNFKISTSVQPGSPNNDAVMYVYKLTSNCLGVFSELACDDDGGVAGENNYMPFKSFTGFAGGDSIYVRIMQYNGGNNGLFNICVSTNPALSNQKVGIGIAYPDSALDVNGHTVIRGSARVGEHFIVSGNTLFSGNTTTAGNATVNGNIAIKGGVPGNGKVLTSDAAGNASWQTPATPVIPNTNSGFGLNLSTSSQTIPNNSATLLTWTTISGFDDGSNYNLSTNEYTAPGAGLYQFDVQIQWTGGTSFSDKKSFFIEIFKNGVYVNGSFVYLANTDLPFHQRAGFTLKLAAADKVTIKARQSTGLAQSISYGFTYYSGYRIY